MMLDDKVLGLDHIQKKTRFLEKIMFFGIKIIDDNMTANNKMVG